MYGERLSGTLGVFIAMQRNIPMSISLWFLSCPLVAQQNPLFPVYFQMLWLSLAPSCSSFHRNKLQPFPLVLKPIAQEMGAHIRTRNNPPASCSLVRPSNVLVCTNCIHRPPQPQHDRVVSSICEISWSLLFYPSRLSIFCCPLGWNEKTFYPSAQWVFSQYQFTF